jgi:hypothetical protein
MQIIKQYIYKNKTIRHGLSDELAKSGVFEVVTGGTWILKTPICDALRHKLGIGFYTCLHVRISCNSKLCLEARSGMPGFLRCLGPGIPRKA